MQTDFFIQEPYDNFLLTKWIYGLLVIDFEKSGLIVQMFVRTFLAMSFFESVFSVPILVR